MKLASALMLKLVPVMPGVVACAVAVKSMPNATITTGSSRAIEFGFFVFIWLMAALLLTCLGRGVHSCADMDLRHQPAEVLGVVGQMVEIGGEEIKGLPGGILGNVARIQDHIEGLTTTQGDRVGVEIHVGSCHVAQQTCVLSDDVHGDPEGGQRLKFRNVQVGDTQQGFSASGK